MHLAKVEVGPLVHLREELDPVEQVKPVAGLPPLRQKLISRIVNRNKLIMKRKGNPSKITEKSLFGSSNATNVRIWQSDPNPRIHNCRSKCTEDTNSRW